MELAARGNRCYSRIGQTRLYSAERPSRLGAISHAREPNRLRRVPRHPPPPGPPRVREGRRRRRAVAPRSLPGRGPREGREDSHVADPHEQRHPALDARRPESARDVGPEAGRPGRGAGRVRGHPHERAGRPDLRPLADVREDHGQVVDRPQPAPPRRGAQHRRPDLLHRVQRRAQPRREHSPVDRTRGGVSKQLGPLLRPRCRPT